MEKNFSHFVTRWPRREKFFNPTLSFVVEEEEVILDIKYLVNCIRTEVLVVSLIYLLKNLPALVPFIPSLLPLYPSHHGERVVVIVIVLIIQNVINSHK